MKSDTPEVEAECAAKGGGPLCPCKYIHADFARKLERERDEARRIAEHWLRVACSPFNPGNALPWVETQSGGWANSPIHKQIAEAGLDPLAAGTPRVPPTQPVENQSRYTGIEPVSCNSEPT